MKSLKELIQRNKRRTAEVAALALAIVICGTSILTGPREVPDFPSYVDPEVVTEIAEEDVPLASKPVVTTKTSSKSSSSKVKLSKKSTVTKTKTLPTTKKTTTKTTTKNTSTAKVVTKVETIVQTATKETYKKNVAYKTVKKVVKTTVKTTVTTTPKATPTPTPKPTTTSNGTYTVAQMAPKVDARVAKAFQKFNFKIIVKSTVSYSGYYNTADQSITLRTASDTVYHELGHFLAFAAGNVDTTPAFASVYAAEKGKYTGSNAAYNTQSAPEYFAESFRDYTLNPTALKAQRPKTYAAIVDALNSLTDAKINQILYAYGPFWKL